jgi:hypothetical protein
LRCLEADRREPRSLLRRYTCGTGAVRMRYGVQG